MLLHCHFGGEQRERDREEVRTWFGAVIGGVVEATGDGEYSRRVRRIAGDGGE
jgi:hypothetical protein